VCFANEMSDHIVEQVRKGMCGTEDTVLSTLCDL